MKETETNHFESRERYQMFKTLHIHLAINKDKYL